MPVREITEKEWDEYEWIPAQGMEDIAVFVRGAKRKQPPKDGYYYVNVTTFTDKEQKWTRAVTLEDK